MKFVLENILLAVDMKDASNVAMQRACDFASKFNAKITALFVSTDTFNHFTDSKKFLEGFCTSKNIGLKIIDRKGKIYDEVVRLQKCSNFSLVLVRAIEDSGWRLFKRNDVSKVVVNSLCPVISFKENSDTFSFKNILLPIEDSKTTRQKVPICSELARAFGSTIHILGVSKSAKNEKKENIQSYIRQTERFLTERGIKYTVKSDFGVNVPEKLVSYGKETNAGLIVIMTDSESSSIFKDSYLLQLLNNSSIPVMSINSKDTLIVGSAGY